MQGHRGRFCSLGYRDAERHQGRRWRVLEGAEGGPHRLRPRRGLGAGPGRTRRRLLLRHPDQERRRHPLEEHRRQGQRLGGQPRPVPAGAAGARPRLPDRVRQPAVGLLQGGKCHLRLQAGRPDQLVLLPGHRGGQLRRDRGQRRGFYRRVHLSGLCALFQGELHPQAVRLQALGLSAQCHPLPGRGAERQPQPLRAERDAVLPLAGRRDGVGRQRAQQGIRKTEHRPAVQCAGSSGRCAGWTVLPVSCAGQRRGEA